MPISETVREFGLDDLDALASEMTDFAVEAAGKQWVNIVPDVEETEVAQGSWLGRALTSRGPVIPIATWFPEFVDGKGAHQPTQLGFAHAAGSEAVPRLAERGVRAPAEWVVVQDHQRRGVILAIPPRTELLTIVEYTVRALDVLSPFDVSGRFIATFARS